MKEGDRLNSRFTFFLSRRQKKRLIYLAKKRNTTVSKLVREAVHSFIQPTVKYIVCCNDFPDTIFNEKKEAEKFKEYKIFEYSKENAELEVRKRYWHIEKCSNLVMCPDPLKLCDFPPPNALSSNCPNAILVGEDDYKWCEKQKYHHGHLICTNDEYKK